VISCFITGLFCAVSEVFWGWVFFFGLGVFGFIGGVGVGAVMGVVFFMELSQDFVVGGSGF
jgi:hypothetical protein